MRWNASNVVCWPRFHAGLNSVHCVLRSVAVRIQKKLSALLPPPRAKVSTWISPGGTLQARILSPDALVTARLISLFWFLPECLLAFAQPGLIRSTPSRARAMVRELIFSSRALVLLSTTATRVEYSSIHIAICTLKYGRHGHAASIHIALRTLMVLPVYVLPRPLCSLYSIVPRRSLLTRLRERPVVWHTSSSIFDFLWNVSPR